MLHLGGTGSKPSEGERTDQDACEKVIVFRIVSKVHSKEREPSSSIIDASNIGYLFLI
jgi:hypothetical protein